MSEREFDVLVYGATGFTGRRVARRLVKDGDGSLRVGLCARSPAKLELLGIELAGTGTVVADSTDPSSVARAVARARVVASCAGPFARYGDPVVEACVEHGCHYVDITGETSWVRGLIERHDARAKQAGVALVPFCGFDSVPADLGVLRLVREVRERFGERLGDVDGVYRLRGGMNGGSLETALTIAESVEASALDDPFLLVPEVEPSAEEREHHADPTTARTEPGTDSGLVPFFMGSINRRVVMRSDFLLRYGREFRYREYQVLGVNSLGAARAAAFGMRAATALLRTRVGRAAARNFGPGPGEGPSESAIRSGSSRLDLYGATESGRDVHLRVEADGDPGNRVTALCVAEAARAAAAGELTAARGLVTPAAAFGERLLARLEATGAWRTTWIDV